MLRVEGLKKYFEIAGGFFGRVRGYVRAVDGVDFSIARGETFGLVGESGSGKTTVGRTLIGLLKPTSGRIHFDRQEITSLEGEEMRRIRRRMQIIFQDPYASLDPRQTVKSGLLEAMRINKVLDSPSEGVERAVGLIERVGLNIDHLYRFPHEFSGGQRQRIAVARALSVKPDFLVLDEPTSFLDVSVQAQILNLLSDLQDEFGMTYLFISHNLSVIKHMSDRVGVMYLGKVVEVADRKALYERPRHPYTFALISSIPVPDPDLKQERLILTGDVPSPVNVPLGCRFNPRCPFATERCKVEEPRLREVEKGHYVACHYDIEFEKPTFLTQSPLGGD